VVAWLAAYAPQIVYYVKLLAQELKQRIELEYVKEWLKGSIINIYNVVGNQIAVYIFILLFIYGGENGRGELGAGATIVNVITYSSFLAYALYPKLLRERKSEDITTSLKMVLMFAIPLTVGGIALSDSYITMLTDK
jgi:O-antigen/teichoic acid export membrane protein